VNWKITSYAVLEATTSFDLQNKVNLHLKNGWELHGGVSISQTVPNGVMHYAQAVVHKELVSP
jgi:hypothetical protein